MTRANVNGLMAIYSGVGAILFLVRLWYLRRKKKISVLEHLRNAVIAEYTAPIPPTAPVVPPTTEPPVSPPSMRTLPVVTGTGIPGIPGIPGVRNWAFLPPSPPPEEMLSVVIPEPIPHPGREKGYEQRRQEDVHPDDVANQGPNRSRGLLLVHLLDLGAYQVMTNLSLRLTMKEIEQRTVYPTETRQQRLRLYNACKTLVTLKVWKCLKRIPGRPCTFIVHDGKLHHVHFVENYIHCRFNDAELALIARRRGK